MDITGIEAHLRKDHPGVLELQPDVSVYFQRDDPSHTRIMNFYHTWLRKLAKTRQKANKEKRNIGVEVIDSVNYCKSEFVPFAINAEEHII